MTTAKLVPGICHWQDEFYIKIYQLACNGLCESHIADLIGVSRETLWGWKKSRSAVRYALEEGDAIAKGRSCKNFREYVYKRLSPDLKMLWDEINLVEDDPSGTVRLEAMLQNQGKGVRQHLFLYAIVHHDYNASAACQSIGISKTTLDRWMLDEDFAELFNEILWHKKNFYETGLVKLVAEGDTAATIFANKTMNRDRGYAEKISVEQTININQNITVLNIDELDLPLEAKKIILAKIREKNTKQITNEAKVIANEERPRADNFVQVQNKEKVVA